MSTMDELRRLAEELGYWPATTDPKHIAKLRADNDRFDRMNAHDLQGLKWSKMCSSVGRKALSGPDGMPTGSW